MPPVEFDDSAHYGFFITSPTLTSQTGKYARLSALVLAGLRAQGILGNMEDGTHAPATNKLWLDKNFDPPVLKEYDSVGSVWVPMTFDRLFGRAVVTELENVGGTADAITVDEPANFISDRLYTIVPASNNTGAATITVTGIGTYDAVYPDGSALDANEFTANKRSVVLFRDGRFEVIFGGGAILAAAEQFRDEAEEFRDDALAAVASVSLPLIGSGDAGKQLTVKDDETGYVLRARNEATFASKTAAEAATIPAAVDTLMMLGFAGSRFGYAHPWIRAGSEPSHGGKLQTADGSWWEPDASHHVRAAYYGGSLANAFAASLASGGKVLIYGPHEMPAIYQDATARNTLEIECGLNASITFTGGSAANDWLLYLKAQHIRISGKCDILCDSKATGVRLSVTPGTDEDGSIDVQGLIVRSPKITASSGTVSGLYIDTSGTRPAGTARVHGNQVFSVAKSLANPFASGITCIGFRNKFITGNVINGVTCDLNDEAVPDMDGIVCFDKFVTGSPGSYEPGISIVEGNYIFNCSGRFVKGQFAGKSVVKDNLCAITQTITLSENHLGIDGQGWDQDIRFNQLYYLAAFTGATGASFAPIMVQVGASGADIDNTGRTVVLRVQGNTAQIRSDKRFYNCITVTTSQLVNYVAVAQVDIDGNHFSRPDGSYAATSFGVNLLWFMTDWAAGSRMELNITNNLLSASTLIRRFDGTGGTAAHGGLGDMTALVKMTVRGNRSRAMFTDAGVAFRTVSSYVSNAAFTSDIQIADNQYSLYGNAWPCPFDFCKLPPGNDFGIPASGELPTPSHANAPAVVADTTVTRRGRLLEVTTDGGRRRFTAHANLNASSLSWVDMTIPTT